jgi:hypothetical protein
MGSSFLREVGQTSILRAVLSILLSMMVELVSGLAQRPAQRVSRQRFSALAHLVRLGRMLACPHLEEQRPSH